MYQSSNYRRSQPAQDALSDKYRDKAQKLQELFPHWSNEDLQSLLEDVSGNVDLAATRISEGQAEQWGSVSRKRDKKASGPAHSHSKDTSSPRERGESRGSRGGRGGRGGPGRGGAARGAFTRGGHQEVNGHKSKSSQLGAAVKYVEEPAVADATSPSTPVDGTATLAEDTSQALAAQTNGNAEKSPDTPAALQDAWGASTPTTWGGSNIPNGTASPAVPVQRVATPKVVKTPATSKMSWAQIVRPQEKPTPPLAAPAPTPSPQPVSPAPQLGTAAPEPSREPIPPHEELPAAPQQQGWEEPTTVQAPTWDDEPRVKTSVEAWSKEPTLAPEELKTVDSEPQPVAVPLAVSEREPVTALLEVQLAPAAESVAIPTRPQPPAAHTRPSVATHRGSAKFKTTDQAVVMPSSSFGTTTEKIGMQFGSLSLGGGDLDAPESEPAVAEPAAGRVAGPPLASIPETQTVHTPVLQHETPVPQAASPPAPTPVMSSQALFHQDLPQHVQTQPQVASPPHLPSSLSQSAIPTQPPIPSTTPASASMSQFSQHSQSLPQQSLSNHQLPQSQSQNQLHSQQHHQYAQHGLPTHLDPAQSQAQHSPSVPHTNQPPSISAAPSYFRQPEAPYFHTPTPPAGQSQESPYGSFGQLGQQHQGQGSHLGGFSGNEYGYNDNQRQGFYDSYSAPTGFGNRNVLGGHDDIKGLPGSQQQPHSAPGLPPANAQSSQQLPPSTQGANQSQTGPGQGPPQSYPPPLPYYYGYPQNQYYGSPYNSGYTVPQPFVKYPTVFQGPPGPQSGPSAASKQPPSAVQPQSPYAQSLYGQQHPSSAYEDIGYSHHSQHSHGQSVGSGLPSNDYGKHQSLYGAGQGMQGFMGLGQSVGPSSGPPLGQRAGASPDNAYKPYGANAGMKDVGAGVGVGMGQGGVGQGPQGRAGIQQPSQGGFYGAQRFGASASGVPQSQQGQQPQGQGPQAHLGYPQSGSDASFYSYQPRQQQGYWQ